MMPYRTVVCSLTIPDKPGPLAILIIGALAVAFAALCIWLAVRIINRRERWAKWMAGALVAVPPIYVLGIGPAGWLRSYDVISENVELTIFYPVYLLMERGPEWLADILLWWLDLWVGNG